MNRVDICENLCHQSSPKKKLPTLNTMQFIN